MSKRLTVKLYLQQLLKEVEDLISHAESPKQQNELEKFRVNIIKTIDEVNREVGDPEILTDKIIKRITQILKLAIKIVGLYDHFFK